MKIILYQCSVELRLDTLTRLIIPDLVGVFYLVSSQLTLGDKKVELVLRHLEAHATDKHTTFLVPETLKRLFFGQMFRGWRDRVQSINSGNHLQINPLSPLIRGASLVRIPYHGFTASPD